MRRPVFLIYFLSMNAKNLIAVDIKKVLATTNGFAVFIGPEDKTFVIYIGQDVGAAILMFQRKVKKPRPLTHDLIGRIFNSLEVKIDRIVINDIREGTFFAQLYLRMENELGKKIVVIDSRPSDCLALALQFSAPIYVESGVIDQLEDVSHIIKD